MIKLSPIFLNDEDEYNRYLHLRFIVVENDEYQRGDYILLVLSGTALNEYLKITYVSHKHQKPGYVVLGLELSSQDQYEKDDKER